MAQQWIKTIVSCSVTTLTLLVACDSADDLQARAVRVTAADQPTIGYVHDELADALTDPVPVDDFTLIASPSEGHYVVRFLAAGQPFELQLEENRSLFSPDLVVVRGGQTMSAQEAGLPHPLKGFVAGDPESWVRMRLDQGRIQGLMYFDDRLLEIRADPWAPEILLLGDAELTDYLPFGVAGPITCGVDTAEVPPDLVADETSPRRSASCQAIQIGLVGDYTFVSSLGGEAGAESEMTSRLNEVDGLYRADINYGFELMEVQTFASQGGPSFNNSSTGVTPLDEFSSWKGQNMPSYGLAHLNVARTQSGTVGLAWVGATCSSQQGAGVSNYLGSGRSSTIVVAHEIGHNVGSGHDSQGAPYVMAPSVNSSATEFSPQSKSSIGNHLGSASCLVPCDGGGDDSADDMGDSSGDDMSDSGADDMSDSGADDMSDSGADDMSDSGADDMSDSADDMGDSSADDMGEDDGTGTGEDGDEGSGGSDGVADDGTGTDTDTGTGGDTGQPPNPPPPFTTTAGSNWGDADVGGCSCTTDGPTHGAQWLWLTVLSFGIRRRRSPR